MKNIKFHVDDYGILPSINNDIIKYISKNKVDSISYICNSKYSKSGLKKLLKISKKKNINISCHINLTEFGAKKFNFNFVKLLYFSIFPNIKVKTKIYSLIENQLNFFLLNIKVEKNTVLIDGHQHVHILPIVQNELDKFFKKKKLFYKLRNSNEKFILFFDILKFPSLILNYFKLVVVKVIYLVFKQNKNYINKKFVGIVCTGIQSKKTITKSISKLNHSSGLTQILFHPIKTNKNYLKKRNLNISDYKYYLSKDRDTEINFLNSIKSKKNFLKKIL